MIYLATLLVLLVSIVSLSCSSPDPKVFIEVSFETADGGRIFGNLYGNGNHAVVLAHGNVFNKESWHQLAQALVARKFQVLAIDFRGYGKSTAGEEEDALYEDILAAVRFLAKRGAKKVSVLGGSMGGMAAAEAAVRAKGGEIDRLILLSPVPIEDTNRILAGSILFIASEEEGMVDEIQAQFEEAPEPKKIEFLEGTAHAQHIFKTEQAQKLTQLIVSFLSG